MKLIDQIKRIPNQTKFLFIIIVMAFIFYSCIIK